MTLATHAVVGGAVASLFPSHPITAFVAGFLSHFVLDAIPHWDYKILSTYASANLARSANAAEPGVSGRIKADKSFIFDLFHFGTDALLGILVTLIIWHPVTVMQWEIILLGMAGGVLPDFLQFVYMRFPHQPMILIQKFHDFMHAEYELDSNKPFFGISLQVIVMACVILLVKYLVQL